MEQHNYKDKLRKVNLRATPARIAVMNFLEQSNQPMDVNSVINYLNYNKIKTDPATAFRVMNTLTQRGITLRVQFHEGKMRYELASKKHHHHLVCEACGKIQDVSSQIIPELEEEIQKKQNFLVKSHTLEFFGLCRNCQK
jgi:Fur family transcriptional regulator, ferric uptake regulator